MKWITPIWSAPVGWCDWLAKTKRRVCIWVLIHLGFVLSALSFLYWLILQFDDIQDLHELALIVLSNAAWPILIIGVGFPAMYLYAMHRLLFMLRTQQNPMPDGERTD